MTAPRNRVRGIAELPASRVENSPGNWRTHDAAQKDKMRGLLGEVGSVSELVVWVPDDEAREALRRLPGPDGFAAWLATFTGKVRLLDGHMRKGLRGKKLGVQITDLDEREAALVLATFDPIGAQAGRDDKLLRELLDGQRSEHRGLEALLADLRASVGAPGGAEPDLDEGPAVDPTDEILEKWAALGCVAGSLWEIPSADGQRAHRVLCGDARKPEDVAKLLDGRQVNVAFTSPPYASQRKYDPESGFRPIPPDDYVEWFKPVQANVRAHLAADGSWFVNIKPASEGPDTMLYVIDLVAAHVRRWGWHFATEFCWERTGMPGEARLRFKNQFEPIYQFARGEWKFRPLAVRHASSAVPSYSPENHWAHGLEDAAGSSGRGWVEKPRAGLAFPGNRLPTFASATTDGAGRHGASFPLGLPAFFARAYSDPGDVVLDPFLGSGTTLLAAEKLGRIGYGTEISSRYVAVTLERLTRSGLTPRRIG